MHGGLAVGHLALNTGVSHAAESPQLVCLSGHWAKKQQKKGTVLHLSSECGRITIHVGADTIEIYAKRERKGELAM